MAERTSVLKVVPPRRDIVDVLTRDYDQSSRGETDIISLLTPPQKPGLISSDIDGLSSGTDVYTSPAIEPDKPFVDPLKDVIDRARNGDQEAMTKIYEDFSPRMYQYSLARLGNVQDAEEAASDIMYKVLGSIGSFEWKDVRFSAWVFRIARNHVISAQRSNNHQVKRTVYDDSLRQSDTGNNPVEDQASNQLLLEEALKATQLLPPNQRKVIKLRLLAGLSVSEAAKVLGKGEGNIKVTQHRAIVRLREIFGLEKERKPAKPENNTLYEKFMEFFLINAGSQITAKQLANAMHITKRQVYDLIKDCRCRFNIPIKTVRGRRGYYIYDHDPNHVLEARKILEEIL